MAAITEADFQQQVIELAHYMGWRHMHCRRSIGKGKRWVTATNVAWPDLTLWSPRQHRFMVIELKSADGKVSAEQREVLLELQAAGVETHVFRPCDLDELAAALRGPRVAAGAS